MIIAVLSVSAPVPAVVGIVINFGKASSGRMTAGVSSHSKAHRSILLFAVRHMDLPPSIALPPPIAMTESCAPALKTDFPNNTSMSRGFGENPEKTLEAIPKLSK